MNFREHYKELIEQLNDGDATEDTESRKESFRKYDRAGLSLHLTCPKNGLDLVVTPEGESPLEQLLIQLSIRTGSIRVDDISTSWSIGGQAPDHLRHAMQVITAGDMERSRTVSYSADQETLLKMQRVIDAFLGKPALEHAKL